MILPVSALGPDGVDLEGEDPVEAFDWVDSPREVVHPAGPLRWKLHAALFGRELVVTGRAEAPFEGVCCRCGGPLARVWGDSVSLSRELPDEGVSEVDLTSELRETILLALPNNPLCAEDCPGLCPRCGKRRADGPCGCADGTEPNAFGALDELLGGPTHEQHTPPKQTKQPRTKTTQRR